MPRKKPTTTKQSTTELITEQITEYIDPDCNRNLIDKYCERQEPALDRYLFENSEIIVEDFNLCKKITKFSQCIQKNFRKNCYESLSDLFGKIEKSVFKCASKVKSNSAQGNVKSQAIKFEKNITNLFIYFNLIYFMIFI